MTLHGAGFIALPARVSDRPKGVGAARQSDLATGPIGLSCPVKHRGRGYNGFVAVSAEKNKERNAVEVEPDIKASNLKRLRRIEGQIRGLQKMVEDERYCADILVQISSVQEALRGVGQALLRNHLRHCVTTTLQKAQPAESEAMYTELVELFSRYSR